MNERTAQLESERDFLIRSLDDLEAERAAGNVDEESYRRLHDDYTARAAVVIRALRDGVDAGRVAPPVPGRRRVLVGALIVGFVLVAAVALVVALGARLPGQTASGNTDPSDTRAVPSRKAQLEAAVEAAPDAVGPRMLLAEELEATNDFAGALRQYDAIVRIDPANAPAYAQSGRILYLSAGRAAAADAAALVDQAKVRLDRAVELDPGFVEARFFRAIVSANEYQDFVGAQNDLQRYLLMQPNGRFAAQARQLLADVTNALTGTPVNPPTTKDATKPTTSTTKKK